MVYLIRVVLLKLLLECFNFYFVYLYTTICFSL